MLHGVAGWSFPLYLCSLSYHNATEFFDQAASANSRFRKAQKNSGYPCKNFPQLHINSDEKAILQAGSDANNSNAIAAFLSRAGTSEAGASSTGMAPDRATRERQRQLSRDRTR